MSTFDSTKRLLPDILSDIVRGKIQLPDFQRGWVWDDEHVRSLLVSIARSFPVGAVMLLETGGEARFQVRPVENVPFSGQPPQAELLILDGQQRLTTLAQVLCLKDPVKTRNEKDRPIERHYYLHIPTALEGPDRMDEALRALEPDRKLKSNFGRNIDLDLSSRELGGVPLSVFELVTASYAADGYNLRDDWYGSNLRKVSSRYHRMAKEPMLGVVEATDFLQAITILHTLERRMADFAAGKQGKQAAAVSAKRAAILSVPLDAYRRWADKVETGFALVAKFMRKECFTNPRDLPYRTQLTPLAAVMAKLGERWLEPRIYEKLSRWFWCGVLGELYGGAVETRIANDVEDLLKWVDQDGDEPRTIIESSFQPERLDRLTSRLSAAYKGLNVLVLRDGAEDFFWKANIRDLDADEVDLDIHHIFPQDWCEKRRIPRKRYNAIVNKTPISYKANRMIGGIAPSQYLQKIQDHKQVKLDDAGMNRILESHLIRASDLRSDDFLAFYESRKQALLKLIEKVTGKNVVVGGLLEEADDIGDEHSDLESSAA